MLSFSAFSADEWGNDPPRGRRLQRSHRLGALHWMGVFQWLTEK